MAPADWRGLGRALDRFPRPRRLLVQWVPHAFGWRSLNLPFCLWLAGRGRRDRVEVMVHEPFVPFAGSWRQRAAAGVHRAMTVLLLRAARAVWLSCGGWEAVLRPYALGRRLPFRWLPVPSNVPVRRDPDAVSALRARVAPDRLLLGHFGTYGGLVTELLRPALVTLLRRRADLGVLLLGRGGGRFRDDLARELPDLAGRLHAAPDLPPAVLSHHLQACDLLLQPYPDGVSGRRTSLMAGLAHGKPVVTTEGPLTEKLWGESGAVRLVPAGKPDELAATTDRLLDDPAGRARLAAAGADLYRDRFDLAQTLAALRGGEVRCGSP
jgi:glycosyltransferase involved in cell wall biosynthesis